MPQRAVSLVLAVFGVAVVLGLVIAGADAYASSRRGPRWWRRLVGAGLVVLAMLGVGSCSRKPRVMCYAPGLPPAAQMSMHRLGEQLPALEEFAKSDALAPEVVAKALEKAEADLKVLASEKALAELPEAERARAVEVRDAVRAKIEEIRARLDTDRGAGALGRSADWRVVTATWREIAPLAESHRSTTAERKSAKEALDSARAAIARLVKSGLLAAGEAELLGTEAARLEGEMYRDPPTDSMVTCYYMAYVPPAQQSLDRLTTRLPMIEALAAEGKVSPAVLAKVVPSIEADIRTLSTETEIKRLTPGQRAKAEETRRAAEEALREVRRLINGSSALGSSPDWRLVVETWREAVPLAKTSGGTSAERKAVKQKLDRAREAVGRLAGQGLLTKAEAGLLVSDAGRMEKDIHRNPPGDLAASCYRYMPQQAEHSLARLARRLPFLKRIAEEGAVHPAIFERIVPAIESDIEYLVEIERQGAWTPEALKRVEELRTSAEAVLNEVKALLREREQHDSAGR